MIAGEEGELCYRLRQMGWKILRLPNEMTLHDAALSRWSQWFKRTVRTGHAFAEGAYLHRNSSERYNQKPTRSAVLWGAAMPVLIVLVLLAATVFDSRCLWALLVPALGYTQLFVRAVRLQLKQGRPLRLAILVSSFWLLAKFPEAIGVLQFWKKTLSSVGEVAD